MHIIVKQVLQMYVTFGQCLLSCVMYRDMGKRKAPTIRKGNNSRHSPRPRCHEDSNYQDAFKQSERYIATQAKTAILRV